MSNSFECIGESYIVALGIKRLVPPPPSMLESKYDSVFAAFAHSDSPVLEKNFIVNSLDNIEEKFANNVFALLSNETDKLVQKLKGKDAKEIQASPWNVVAPLQQLTYALWHSGWQLGQEHAGKALEKLNSTANFARSSPHRIFDVADFASDEVVKVDAQIKKKDRRIKTSKQYGNQAAYISDKGIPISQSGLRQALNDRTLKVASDLDKTTQKEIKEALVAAATPQEKTGKPISAQELEARINLALGRQKARTGEEVRTKIPKIGGGFFSRAKLIARTELTAAYATSSLAAYQAAGVTHIRWVTLEDMQRCPKCASRHGMVVALADVQTIAANPLPLHPNCRCLWQPIPNGYGGDKLRNDPKRSPGGLGLGAIAASWLLGRVINASQEQQQEVPQTDKQKSTLLPKLILGAGVGALSLAALYFLVLKNKSGLSINKLGKTVIDSVDDIIPAILKQSSPQPQLGAASVGQSQPQTEGAEVGSQSQATTNYTGQNVLSAEAQQQFPALAASNANLRNISLKQLMKLTGLSKEDARTLKEEILEWIRQDLIRKRKNVQSLLAPARQLLGGSFPPKRAFRNDLSVQGLNIAEATPQQLQQVFGLPKAAAAKVKQFLDQGGSISSLEDLAKVPGIGPRYAARVAARISQYRPNINAVPNTIASVSELAAQLGVGTKVAQAILDERDAGGDFTGIADLTKRVKGRLKNAASELGRTYLGKGSIQNIFNGADFLPTNRQQGNVQQVRVGGQEEQRRLPGAREGRADIGSTASEPVAKSPKTTGATSPPSFDNRLTPTITTSTNTGRQSRINPPPPRTTSRQGFTELDAEYDRLTNEVDDYHNLAAGSIPPKLANRRKIVESRASQASKKARENYTRVSDIASQLDEANISIEAEVENLERSYGQFLNPANDGYFDNAPSSIRAIDLRIGRSIRDAEVNNASTSESISRVNRQINDLKKVQQDVARSVNKAPVKNARNALSNKASELESRIAELGESPQTAELQRQSRILQSELAAERDRSVAQITARIQELEKLSANLTQDFGNAKQRLNDAKAKLQELRARLNRLPTSVDQLDDAARVKYAQSRRVAASSQKIQSSVAKYRTNTAEHSTKLNEVTAQQTSVINNYELQHQSAMNNIASTVTTAQAKINYNMQLLRLMSGPEGVAWVLEQVETGTEAGLVLRTLGRGGQGVKSITTMEDAAKFREYAMNTLHGRILGQSQLLEERLQYPQKLAQEFLDAADLTAADLNELQKAIVIKHQDDAKGLINDLDNWEQGSSLATPGGGVVVNSRIRDAKNQIINEVTNSRRANAEAIKETLSDQQAWRTRLTKQVNAEPIFEVDGRTVSRSQILDELKKSNEEATRLRSMKQVVVEPIETPESAQAKIYRKTYQARVAEIQQQVDNLQPRLAELNKEINRRTVARTEGRKALPIGKLEAEKLGVEGQLNNLLAQLDDLHKNRNFRSRNNLTNFNLMPKSRIDTPRTFLPKE